MAKWKMKQASVDARLAELRRLTQGAWENRARFDAELRDVAGSLSVDGMLRCARFKAMSFGQRPVDVAKTSRASW
jgi:hypothetical protein